MLSFFEQKTHDAVIRFYHAGSAPHLVTLTKGELSLENRS
jgi:hypothetical protein